MATACCNEKGCTGIGSEHLQGPPMSAAEAWDLILSQPKHVQDVISGILDEQDAEPVVNVKVLGGVLRPKGYSR